MPYKDSARQREYQRQWMTRRRRDYLEGKSCVDCGSTENLEVDHVDRETKISHKIWSWSTARRTAELKKCVVRCRECHSTKGVRSSEHDFGAVITYEDALEIRRRFAKGGITQRELALDYGLTCMSVSRITRGEKWSVPRVPPRQAS